MHTTTAPKFPIHSLLNSHNTRVPSYEFDIDLFGTGFDVFVGQVSKELVSEPTDLDVASLSKIVDFPTEGTTLQSLSSLIPVWARQAYFTDYRGIDISKPFEMTVRNDANKLLFHIEDGRYPITEPANDNYPQDKLAEFMGSYLYASDIYPIQVRYRVISDMPFDPSLITMLCGDVSDGRLIDRFEYNYQIIEPEFIIWPFEHDRVVRFVSK